MGASRKDDYLSEHREKYTAIYRAACPPVEPPYSPAMKKKIQEDATSKCEEIWNLKDQGFTLEWHDNFVVITKTININERFYSRWFEEKKKKEGEQDGKTN